jgi:hypothetical protein
MRLDSIQEMRKIVSALSLGVGRARRRAGWRAYQERIGAFAAANLYPIAYHR